ncbi:MAG: hypothetical protein NZ561_01230 [Phycisphaerae bacterium]|nr:hypothetical protein [Phycisphaerae bacterium]MDW8262520.1 hypothetical protein [Phycisphaerales bacterium]
MLRKLASAYGRTLEDTFQRILRFVCSLPEPLRRAIVNEDPARRQLLIQGLVELMRQEGVTIDPQQEMYLAELDRRLKKFADDLKESQQAAWRAHAPGQDNQSGE